MSYDMNNAYEDAASIAENVVQTSKLALRSTDPVVWRAALKMFVDTVPGGLQEIADEVEAMG